MIENESEKLKINWLPKTVLVNLLTPFEKNPRKITPEAYEKLVNSLKEDGYHQRIITTPDLRVIGGHQRIKALKSLGITEIEVLTADREISDEQFKRILVRDNLGYGEWELETLSELLPVGELLELGLPADIAKAFVPTVKQGLTDDDAVPEPPKEPVTVLGDLWILGDNRLLCGDSTSIDAVEKLMDGQKADMVFTDPPYNVDYGADLDSRHKIRTIKNDKMNVSDWDDFVSGYLACLFAFCDGNMYISMSDKELGHLQLKFVEMGGKWASFIIWVKDSLVLSAKDYHSRHETILYGWKDGVKARKRVEDRKNDDVWEMPRPKRSDSHPTMKPVELVQKCLINSSDTGHIVLDLFGGSGTTMIAAEKTGRHACLMELDPKYCDVIITRWQEFTGQQAIHAETGEPFTKPEKAAA